MVQLAWTKNWESGDARVDRDSVSTKPPKKSELVNDVDLHWILGFHESMELITTQLDGAITWDDMIDDQRPS